MVRKGEPQLTAVVERAFRKLAGLRRLPALYRTGSLQRTTDRQTRLGIDIYPQREEKPLRFVDTSPAPTTRADSKVSLGSAGTSAGSTQPTTSSTPMQIGGVVPWSGSQFTELTGPARAGASHAAFPPRRGCRSMGKDRQENAPCSVNRRPVGYGPSKAQPAVFLVLFHTNFYVTARWPSLRACHGSSSINGPAKHRYLRPPPPCAPG